jgi:tight adherence protein C
VEYLIHFFSSITQDPDQAQWLFSITIGVAISLFGIGVLILVASVYNPLRRRLQAVSQASPNEVSTSRAFGNTLKPLSPYLLPKKEKKLSHIQSKLRHAGFRSINAPLTFHATKLVLSLTLGTLVILLAPIVPFTSTSQVVFTAIFGCFVGIVLPNLILSHLVELRKRHTLNGFPDALDLLVACTEAGLGLNAALQRVADELHVSHPALAEELALVNTEIRAGVDRVTAMRNLSKRTGLEEIRGLVSLLSQSLRFGTSIADTLRIYSEEYRDKRMQRAEEQAAKIGIKMIFPLVLCLFPAFFVVAIGPAILGVLRTLQGL